MRLNLSGVRAKFKAGYTFPNNSVFFMTNTCKAIINSSIARKFGPNSEYPG